MEKYTCVCGGKTSTANKSNHRKTKRHQAFNKLHQINDPNDPEPPREPVPKGNNYKIRIKEPLEVAV